MADYIFDRDLTPFKKGEVLSDTDPRLGDNSDPKIGATPGSVAKHFKELSDMAAIVPKLTKSKIQPNNS